MDMKKLLMTLAVTLLGGTLWAQNNSNVAKVSVSDQGDGTYKNPVVFADFPDPDVIRVGDTFYMATTTMHHFPGCTMLKSKDMVNWEYCAHPLEQLSTKDSYNLLNGQNAYARGMWACAMTWYDGKFYILINGNDAGGFVLSATNPEGKWEKKQLSRIYYDPGFLFDNGKVYVVCGNGNIQMCELDEDFNFIQEKNVIKGESGLEGSHLYKIGEYYYIYSTYGGWPSGQTVFRSKNIFGPYEEKMLVEKYINGAPNTIHQGSLIDTPSGEWWTILQQDLGCFGRMPNLQPVQWEDGWPIVGNNGVPYTTHAKPNVETTEACDPLPTTDCFRSYPIAIQWEWNHNPDDGAWSLFERPGWLRLKTSGTADRLTQARNMLTQRIFAFHDKPSQPSTGTVRIDVSHLQEGDRAGICILQDPYAAIAVEVKNGKKQLIWWQDQLTTNDNFTPSQKRSTIEIGDVIYLRAALTYGTSKTQFYYSTDNVTYKALGGQTSLSFNLTVFVGARFGLFCYASAEGSEGYADFDWFTTESSFNESDLYPDPFEGYSDDVLTVEKLEQGADEMELMVGNSSPLQLIATFCDGRTENVAAQATFTSSSDAIATVQGGQVRGISAGNATIGYTYTDPKGNTMSGSFLVHSTFFPFGAEYINTSLFSQGTYTEETRTFKTGQYGQMGWEYPNGADMSGFKYLVVNLKKTSSGAHLNLFSAPSIWSDCCATPDFGSKKQIVLDLSKAKYTSGDKTGQALDTKNICIVSFWANNATIVVEDMYLTNNSDYTPETTAIRNVERETMEATSVLYDLSGRRYSDGHSLKPGIYIKNGTKIVIR